MARKLESSSHAGALAEASTPGRAPPSSPPTRSNGPAPPLCSISWRSPTSRPRAPRAAVYRRLAIVDEQTLACRPSICRFTGTVNGHVVPTARCRRRAFQKDDERGGAAHTSVQHSFAAPFRLSTPGTQRLVKAKSPVISVRRARVRVQHGGRGEGDRVRGGAAEGGAPGAAATAEAAEAGQDRAPAPPVHAPVVRRRRQRRGDAEAAARGGTGGGRRRGRAALLRVAGRLHRELPQEPGLRDHLRPPRHGGVRGGGGGGGDDGGLAVQEAGHGADRGGDGGVPGGGGVGGDVRVGVERARQDRADAHARLQLVRGRAHRQRRRRALLRRPDAGLVRRRLSRAHRSTAYIHV